MFRAALPLLIFGVGAGVWLAWALVQGQELTPVHAAAGVAALGALGALGAARSRGPLGRWCATLGGMAAVLGIGWSYDSVSIPYIDTVRPWGMDWEPWPLLRLTFGAALLVALAPAAFGARTLLRRLALALPGIVLCGALVSYWAIPRWFEMDLVAREGIVPSLPEFLPRPGRVGAGDTPVVIGGELHHLHWSQYAYRDPPLRALWYMAHRELALAGIAQGMHWSLSDAQVARGTLDPATAARRAEVRAGLWTLARGAMTGWLYLQAGAVALWAWTIVRLVRPPGPREKRAHGLVLVLVVASAPAINLLLLVGSLLGGLPEASGVAPRIAVESVGMLLAIAVLRRAAPGDP